MNRFSQRLLDHAVRWGMVEPCRRFRLGKRGTMATFMAIALPPLVLFGGMTIDQGYVTYRYQMMKRTAQAAALAGETALWSYYTSGGTYTTASMTTINSYVSTVVQQMMPTATYGNVVSTTTSNTTSSVQIGVWDNVNKTFTASTSNPNAIKITAKSTSANGNAVSTFFGGIIGKGSVDMTTSAVASYGAGLSGAGNFNTIILNDISGSFSSQIGNQRTVDNAILDCISSGTNGNGKVGLTVFGGHSQALNLTSISGFNSSTYNNTLDFATTTKVATMKTWITSNLKSCGNTGMPACSGSNIAAGL